MLKYKANGTEESIIFINGGGTGPWIWHHQVDKLENFKRITFDLPGHGDNNDIEFESIEVCARAVCKIIEEVSPKVKVTLIGLSIGAQIAMQLMSEHPDLIDKVILISGSNKPMKWAKYLLKPMTAMAYPLTKNRKFAKLQSKEIYLPDDLFDQYYRDSMLVSKNSLLHVIASNLSFEFKGSHIKTLILYGSKENFIIKQSSNKNKALLNNSRLIEVEGAGHGIPYEEPEKLNQLICDFMLNESE